MSTVRMSDYLRSDIQLMYEASYDKANPELELDTKYGDQVYNTHVGPHIKPVLDVLAKTFGDIFDTSKVFGKSSKLTVITPITTSRLSYANADASFTDSSDKGKRIIESNLEEAYTLYLPLSTERSIPKVINTRGWTDYCVDVEFIVDRYSDKALNYLCECFEYNSKLQAKKQISSDEVRNLLSRFTTLNQALKAWPALSKLVTPEKLAKVHEKQQRKRVQELQKEMADEVIIGNDLNKTILAGALLGDDN